MKAFRTLFETELKLSLRGMDMIIFAIFMPIIVITVIGLIYGNKPAFEGSPYSFLDQSFGAITTIAICAGGVMGLPLVISDYRGKKILKRYKVTPVSPLLIIMVQVCIYTLYAFVSLLSIFIIAITFFNLKFQGSVFNFMLGWLLVVFSLFSIGIMVGGISKNQKIAGVIASILYFPMLIFSGATLPYEIMPLKMQQVADILPLTQGIKILKAETIGIDSTSSVISIIILIFIALVCSTISIKFFNWE